MTLILSNLLLIASLLLLLAGLFFKKSKTYKDRIISKKLIIGGIISLVISLAVDLMFNWDTLIQAYEEGRKAAGGI